MHWAIQGVMSLPCLFIGDMDIGNLCGNFFEALMERVTTRTINAFDAG